MDKIINDSWNKTSDDTRIFIQEKVIHEIYLSSFSNSLSIYMNLQLELDNWTLYFSWLEHCAGNAGLQVRFMPEDLILLGEILYLLSLIAVVLE